MNIHVVTDLARKSMIFYSTFSYKRRNRVEQGSRPRVSYPPYLHHKCVYRQRRGSSCHSFTSLYLLMVSKTGFLFFFYPAESDLKISYISAGQDAKETKSEPLTSFCFVSRPFQSLREPSCEILALGIRDRTSSFLLPPLKKPFVFNCK